MAETDFNFSNDTVIKFRRPAWNSGGAILGGHPHRQTQLENETQRNGSGLQDFEVEVVCLVRLAFPSAVAELWEQLATQAFDDGIKDIEVKQAIGMDRHIKSCDAPIRALEFEAAKQASNVCPNMGELQVVSEVEKLRDINDRGGQLEEKFGKLSPRFISEGNRRGNRYC
ncbi:hypothetical protein Trydic_g15837 [Trypoxylus dichotomus]